MMNAVRQNAEFTYRYNKTLGRHGWLRLTPAYSVKIVEQILSELSYTPTAVLEPFSGTGTTELVCANKGIKSFAFDVNPFLVWLATVKTENYSMEDIALFKDKYQEIISNIADYEQYDFPNIFNIERWWNSRQLVFLAKMKTAIYKVQESKIQNLLKIAFCRTLIELSNAAFDHVSTSFKNDTCDDGFTFDIGTDIFASACRIIIETAAVNPLEQTNVILHDASSVYTQITNEYDMVITSPPYPNRISYIRELRPYMYWLDYLSSSDDASNLDWNTIGGTWGSATNKLNTWKEKSTDLPDYLYEKARKIACAENKSAQLMANYVLKYFDDMNLHFKSIYKGIKTGGYVYYIVGNSNFYGNTVPSEKLYIDMLTQAGFVGAKAEIIRKRNCNKELFEFLVCAKK